MTNVLLVDDAVALPVQLIFLRQPFIAGGQTLGVVLRLAVLNIELQDRVLDGLAGFRPQGGAVLVMRWNVPTGVIFGFIISAHPLSEKGEFGAFDCQGAGSYHCRSSVPHGSTVRTPYPAVCSFWPPIPQPENGALIRSYYTIPGPVSQLKNYHQGWDFFCSKSP